LKLKLAERIIEGGKFNDDESGPDKVSDLEKIMQYGLGDMMNDASSVPDQDIEAILAGATILDHTSPDIDEESDPEAPAEKGGDKSSNKGLEGHSTKETEDLLTNWKLWEGTDYGEKGKVADENQFDLLLSEAEADKNAINKKRSRHEMTEEEERDAKRQREEKLERAQKEKEKKKAEAVAKKIAKWAKNGYTSYALNDDPTESGSGGSYDVPERTPASLRYLVGDATRPCRSKPGLVIHCVDTSGSWCTGRGMFGSLEKVSSLPQVTYESAKENGDLALGDAHLRELTDAGGNSSRSSPVDTPVDDLKESLKSFLELMAPSRVGELDSLLDRYDDPADMWDALREDYSVSLETNPVAFKLLTGGKEKMAPSVKESSLHLGLLVVHKASKGRGIGPIDMRCLEKGLRKIAAAALQLGAVVHLPRIGARDRSTNWYAIERIVKKTLIHAGVPAVVYYFKRRAS